MWLTSPFSLALSWSPPPPQAWPLPSSKRHKSCPGICPEVPRCSSSVLQCAFRSHRFAGPRQAVTTVVRLNCPVQSTLFLPHLRRHFWLYWSHLFEMFPPLAWGASGCLHSLSTSLITSCFAASFFSARSVVQCPCLQTLYTLRGWCMCFHSFNYCLWIGSPKSLSRVSLRRVPDLGFSCLVIFLPVSVTEI